MALLDKVLDAATGGLGSSIFEAIKAYFPPDITPEQAATIKLESDKIELQRQLLVKDEINNAEKLFNERVASYEGTAIDLKSVPVLGPLMLFLRGAQRPLWGYGTLYVDVMIYSEHWKIVDELLKYNLLVVNFLVLGFLFGERAVINVLPLVRQYFESRDLFKANLTSK